MNFLAGDIHYFRIYPGGLRRRLEYMKAFGVTVLQTYVPWNLHEPQKGKFCFEGLCDLEGFLKLAQEMGFQVYLRPGPYICSEWDLGGLPSWLLKEKLHLRTTDPVYMRHVADFFQVLCPVFLPYLKTNGGPIEKVCVENEYGGYGNDTGYMQQVKELLLQNGVDVPLYTTDGYRPYYLQYGHIPDVQAAVNYRVESKLALETFRTVRADYPALIGEYWSGRSIHKGEPYAPRNIGEVADGFKEALENEGLVTFYMFAGGTNFGFMNGANYGVSFGSDAPAKYIAHATTYEEDALLNEQGLPTEKYFACRKVYWDFLGEEAPPMPHVPYETQTPVIKLTESASLWEQVDYSKAVESVEPLTMEELGQSYGYILYRTELVGCGAPLTLDIPNLRDRADVYLNRRYLGTLMRDRAETVEIDLKAGEKATLELLVENMGRINQGPHLPEKKGIDGSVFLANRIFVYHWQNLPLDIQFKTEAFSPIEGPVLLKGVFKAEPNKDTFLDMRGLKKGYAVVNGFNLGRYWNVGPQYTLYVPGELLREDNTIEIFEQYGAEEPIAIPTCTDSILK